METDSILISTHVGESSQHVLRDITTDLFALQILSKSPIVQDKIFYFLLKGQQT